MDTIKSRKLSNQQQQQMSQTRDNRKFWLEIKNNLNIIKFLYNILIYV